jgi:hypothetical protein
MFDHVWWGGGDHRPVRSLAQRGRGEDHESFRPRITSEFPERKFWKLAPVGWARRPRVAASAPRADSSSASKEKFKNCPANDSGAHGNEPSWRTSMTGSKVLSALIYRWRNCYEDYPFHARCAVSSGRVCGPLERAGCQGLLRPAGSAVRRQLNAQHPGVLMRAVAAILIVVLGIAAGTPFGLRQPLAT